MGQLTMSIGKKQKNKVFVIQPLSDIENLTPTHDDFNNVCFKVNAKMVKGTLYSGKENQYSVEPGSNFEWQISKALYKAINEQEIKGQVRIGVEMSVTNDYTSWLVSDMDNDSITPWDNITDTTEQDVNKTDETSQINSKEGIGYGYKDVKSRDDKRSLEIKWGMAFNNATRLVSHIQTQEGVEDKVHLIKIIMPEMFKIAKGLDDIIKEEQGESSFEQAKKDERMF